jgi:hypothetical protein
VRVSERRELWVDAGSFGRCRLDGNAHTSPGRISAWSETYSAWVTISRSDIRETSPEAWAWIDGFLAGNEPDFHEFLGIDWADAESVAEDDPAHDRYDDALASFRATGSLPFPIERRPTLPPPPGLRPAPWSAAGGEVFGWDGTSWRPLDPQPELRFALLAGTLCDERGHCEPEIVGERHTFCADCGNLSEGGPAIPLE